VTLVVCEGFERYRNVEEVKMERSYVPLFQEKLKADGGVEWRFWMLVGCILVNQTRWAQARPVFDRLQRDYPTQYALSSAHIPNVMRIVRRLGLYERRAMNLVRLAQRFDRHLLYGKERGWPTVKDLPGCGEYAHASWRIFVLERRDVVTEDKRLAEYLDHTRFG
jgi:endonuclease III